MKHITIKAIVCVVFCVLALNVYAQDIIVTTNAQKIEAKILEVSKTEIKYKEMDNLNGPTFILETNEISSIIYSNGQVKVYNQPANDRTSDEQIIASSKTEQPVSSAPTIDESTAQILLLSGESLIVQITDMKTNYVAYIIEGKPNTMPTSLIDKVTFLKNSQVKEYQHTQQTQSIKSEKPDLQNTNVIISKIDGYYYMGDKKMTKAQYLNFVQSNCKEAWNSYKKGCKLWKAGWGLFGAGVGCIIIGVPMAISSSQNTVIKNKNSSGANSWELDSRGLSLYITGTVFSVLGASFTIASIPCITIGANKRNNSHSIYNKQCASPEESLSIRIQASPSGVGLALAF